jgi:hypothetical protein
LRLAELCPPARFGEKMGKLGKIDKLGKLGKLEKLGKSGGLGKPSSPYSPTNTAVAVKFGCSSVHQLPTFQSNFTPANNHL